MDRNQPSGKVRRWLYGERFEDFLKHSATQILGELAQRAGGDLELTQNNAWQEEIEILKALRLPESERASAKIYFEYTIPRLGRRADVILLVGHVLFVLEFKAGESHFHPAALDQVWDYALDLKNFHEASHDIFIAPVLVATKAGSMPGTRSNRYRVMVPAPRILRSHPRPSITSLKTLGPLGRRPFASSPVCLERARPS